MYLSWRIGEAAIYYCQRGMGLSSYLPMDPGFPTRGGAEQALADAADMARVQDGDDSAFSAIVRRHQTSLVNFFRRLGAYSEAEDLAQETFLRVFRYRGRYRPTARFATFLYTVARHVWCDRLRKLQRAEAERAALEQREEDRRIERREVVEERLAAIREAVEELPEHLRMTVVLIVYQEFDYETTARILDIPLGTVKSRMHEAMQRLKRRLGAGE